MTKFICKFTSSATYCKTKSFVTSKSSYMDTYLIWFKNSSDFPPDNIPSFYLPKCTDKSYFVHSHQGLQSLVQWCICWHSVGYMSAELLINPYKHSYLYFVHFSFMPSFSNQSCMYIQILGAPFLDHIYSCINCLQDSQIILRSFMYLIQECDFLMWSDHILIQLLHCVFHLLKFLHVIVI